MKKVTTLLFAVAMGLSIVFIDSTVASAATTPQDMVSVVKKATHKTKKGTQTVYTKTKHGSKVVYHRTKVGGKWVYHKGHRGGAYVFHKVKRGGKWTYVKTRNFLVGKPKRIN